MKTIIRNETPADYRAVETLTREAFWNQNFPGCDEHYLVHVMRSHPDFIPQLDFVLELDGEIIGSVLYTKAALLDEQGQKKTVLTFGPVSIAPEHQRKGYGKALLRQLAVIAVERGCGRLEWVCLDWNQPSIDFYKSLGVEPQSDWTIYRLTGATLTALAES